MARGKVMMGLLSRGSGQSCSYLFGHCCIKLLGRSLPGTCM